MIILNSSVDILCKTEFATVNPMICSNKNWLVDKCISKRLDIYTGSHKL